jgi:catechol 2,3-dioxygenase-like lactoylglutathione lyase family enzyme
MPAVPIERFQFFTIWTKDLAASRNFYVEILGFPILREQAGNFFQVEIAGVPICVDLHPEGGPAQPNQIGIEVSSLEATIGTLREKGLEVHQGIRPGSEGAWAAVKDPDGHELIFIAAPP